MVSSWHWILMFNPSLKWLGIDSLIILIDFSFSLWTTSRNMQRSSIGKFNFIYLPGVTGHIDKLYSLLSSALLLKEYWYLLITWALYFSRSVVNDLKYSKKGFYLNISSSILAIFYFPSRDRERSMKFIIIFLLKLIFTLGSSCFFSSLAWCNPNNLLIASFFYRSASVYTFISCFYTYSILGFFSTYYCFYGCF